MKTFRSQDAAKKEVMLCELKYSTAAVACVQNIFNHSRDFSVKYFGHSIAGTEGQEFFRWQQGPDNPLVYDIVINDGVYRSVGVTSIRFFPWINQGYISLLLIDVRYRNKGLGAIVVKEAESLIRTESKYISVKISCDERDAIRFWVQQGYVPEVEIPESITSAIATIPGSIRLVKKCNQQFVKLPKLTLPQENAYR